MGKNCISRLQFIDISQRRSASWALTTLKIMRLTTLLILSTILERVSGKRLLKQTKHFLSLYLLEIAVVAYEKDAKVQEEKRKPLTDATIPFYLSKLEAIAKENDGHLALKRITWADFYFAGIRDYLSVMAKRDITAEHPNLMRVVDNVHAIESVRKWIERRPHTDA